MSSEQWAVSSWLEAQGSKLRKKGMTEDYKFNFDSLVRDTAIEVGVRVGTGIKLGMSQVEGMNILRGKQNTYPVEVNEDSERKETLILKTDNANSIEFDAVIDCNATKNIVSTAINGVSGTIKEWVSNGDVAITIDVTLLGEGNAYPREKVAELMSLLQANQSLQVGNKTLNEVWGVTRIVVTSFSMPPTPCYNYQTFSISAVSDEAYVIEEEILK